MGMLNWLGFGNQLRRPEIWDIQNNLVLKKDGSVFAIYEVPSRIINSVDSEAKEEVKRLIFSVLGDLSSYKDFSIRTLPLYQDLVNRFNLLSEDVDWDSLISNLGADVLEGMLDYLEDNLGEIYEYKHYLTVPLKSIHVSVDLKSVVSDSYRNVRNKTLSLVGFSEAVSTEWYQQYKTQSDVLDNTLSSLGVRPLKRGEAILVCAYPYFRGMQIEKDFQIELFENSFENLDDVNIALEHINIIKTYHFDKISYQVLLPVDKLPENVSYLHLQEEVQHLGFPVESIFLGQFSMPKGMFSLLGRSRRARQRLKNTEHDAYEDKT